MLEEIDELESEFAIKMVVLAGDFGVAFDAFHSQNCNARWAFLPYLLYRTYLPLLPHVTPAVLARFARSSRARPHRVRSGAAAMLHETLRLDEAAGPAV